MAWRIVQQPNGLLARFSDVVDDFTIFHMTREEAEEECRSSPGMGSLESQQKVQRGIDAGSARWQESLRIIRNVHGEEIAQERETELSQPIEQGEEQV